MTIQETQQEIIDWMILTDEERKEIMERLNGQFDI